MKGATRDAMVGRVVTAALAMGLLTSGCIDNTAPGNDREAELDPPAKPAEMAEPAAALSGIATALVIPQTLTDADLGALPAAAGRCLYRYTTVGLPVVAYDASNAVVKLNDTLVPLPSAGEGRYAGGGVEVTVHPLREGARDDETFEAEFVLRLDGAPDELGYHGYADCGAGGG